MAKKKKAEETVEPVKPQEVLPIESDEQPEVKVVDEVVSRSLGGAEETKKTTLKATKVFEPMQMQFRTVWVKE